VPSSEVRLVGLPILVRYVNYKKRQAYVELFRKCNIGKKWGIYKFEDIEMREGSSLTLREQDNTL